MNTLAGQVFPPAEERFVGRPLQFPFNPQAVAIGYGRIAPASNQDLTGYRVRLGTWQLNLLCPETELNRPVAGPRFADNDSGEQSLAAAIIRGNLVRGFKIGQGGNGSRGAKAHYRYQD
jgi:hypothetical protein